MFDMFKGAIGGVLAFLFLFMLMSILNLSLVEPFEKVEAPENNANQVYNDSVGGVISIINYQEQESIQKFLTGEESLTETAVGSGFVYKQDEEGYYYALTNNHVIEGSDDIRILLSSEASTDDNLIQAEVLGSDPVYDVAVVKFKTDKDVKVLPLGDSDEIQTGEVVYAIGSPYGIDFSGSITAGIISAPLRSFDRLGYSYSYIQTDAAINPGNSGGPLLNEDGEVVGMNTLKIADGETDNMGFAIPINMVKDIAEELEKGNIPSQSEGFAEEYSKGIKNIF